MRVIIGDELTAVEVKAPEIFCLLSATPSRDLYLHTRKVRGGVAPRIKGQGQAFDEAVDGEGHEIFDVDPNQRVVVDVLRAVKIITS